MAMQAVVVDTDVVSFLFRGDSRAELYRPHLQGRVLIVSFMTVAELYRWARERNWGTARRAQMEQHLRQFVMRPSTRTLCQAWADVTHQARRSGCPISAADAWHAAVALVEGVPLVTHNGSDYAGVQGLAVVSATT